MTLTKANLTALKVETLAKLYLESKPAEISDQTIAQLCDWLMGEFQQLPLNLQFSDYMRYENAEEMFADIKQGQLWVSAESYDSSVYPNPIYGFIFQGMHDYDHYLTKNFLVVQAPGFIRGINPKSKILQSSSPRIYSWGQSKI
ncbi:hypothetical protein [Microcoleus sp.]|uniref:hypothetical protein n=1 Tax=Microcoleus sp. TaxID=44472 RepID=UPI0035948B65